MDYIDKVVSGVNKMEFEQFVKWKLYDFFFWGNYFQNSIDTVSKWFDERRFSINYDLLKEGKRNYNENP